MKTILKRSMTLVAVAGLAGAGGWSASAMGQEQERRDPPASEEEAPRRMLGIQHWHSGSGVMVGAVRRGSPADRAGIRFGDRIVAVNGHPLLEPLEDEDRRELPEGVSSHQARLVWLVEQVPEDEPVTLDVQRGLQTMTVEVVAEVLPDYEDDSMWPWELWEDSSYDSFPERLRDAMDQVRFRVGPDDFEFGWIAPRVTGGRVSGDVGFPVAIGVTPSVRLIDAGDWRRDRFHFFGGNLLEMVELNPELGAYFGTEEGVLVLDVDENVTLGLRPGDVVVSIGGRTVDEVADMQRILASYVEDEAVDFGIWRNGARATVVGTIR